MEFNKSKKILVIGRAGMDIYPEPPGTKISEVKNFSTHYLSNVSQSFFKKSKEYMPSE